MMKLTQSHNESGVVLVTVVMVVLVMSLLLTAILGQNLSQVSVGQAKVDEIKAQELAMGAFWKAQADMTNASGNSDPLVSSEVINAKTYTVTVDPRPPTTLCPGNVCPNYTVTVTY